MRDKFIIELIINKLKDISRLDMSSVASVYEKYDTDKDGTLNPVELQAFFTDLAAARADLALTQEGYAAWFASIDKDGDGTIAPSELEAYLVSINYSA